VIRELPVDKLLDIARRAVDDYGFRQVAQWSPEDLVAERHLSPGEAEVLKGPLKHELDRLPIPVEPGDRGRELENLERVIRQALG
jgi:hypothetical protein